MRKISGVMAIISALVLLAGCSLFESLFMSKYQAIGGALVKVGGKALGAQKTAANESASPKGLLSAAVRTLATRETGTIATGLTYGVSEPATTYTAVQKWENGAWSAIGTYTEPPAKDDPNGPGLWKITMSITCDVTSTYDHYASGGYTFSGTITQHFAATYVWELDIPGTLGGQATSVQKSAETDMTISGTVAVSGKDTGTFVFDAMAFHIKEDEKGNRECTYQQGAATFAGADVTDDLIDPIEEGVEKMKI